MAPQRQGASGFPCLMEFLPLFSPTGTSLVQHLMTVLISEQGRIFAVPQADVPGSQLEIRPVRPRNTVEWISEEDGEDSRSESNVPSPADLPSGNAVSLEATPGPVLKNTPPEHKHAPVSYL